MACFVSVPWIPPVLTVGSSQLCLVSLFYFIVYIYLLCEFCS
jgi:hypothetical protein